MCAWLHQSMRTQTYAAIRKYKGYEKQECASSLYFFKNKQRSSVSSESSSWLIPINLSSEQGAGSQSWPLKFEHDLTLCLQLSNVFATAWLLSSSGFHRFTPEHVQIGGGHDHVLKELCLLSEVIYSPYNNINNKEKLHYN